MEQGAFNTEAEARQWLATNPICLELYYEKHHGLFAVESESLEGTPEAICSPYTKEPFFEWVDLGLPSRRLWAAENAVIDGKHHFTYDEAVRVFGEDLPVIEKWQELCDNCSWVWDDVRKGYTVTGPNGNCIFLPAAGWYYASAVYHGGKNDSYWSASPRGDRFAHSVSFLGDNVNPRNIGNRREGFSVRLCREP